MRRYRKLCKEFATTEIQQENLKELKITHQEFNKTTKEFEGKYERL